MSSNTSAILFSLPPPPLHRRIFFLWFLRTSYPLFCFCRSHHFYLVLLISTLHFRFLAISFLFSLPSHASFISDDFFLLTFHTSISVITTTLFLLTSAFHFMDPHPQQFFLVFLHTRILISDDFLKTCLLLTQSSLLVFHFISSLFMLISASVLFSLSSQTCFI